MAYGRRSGYAPGYVKSMQGRTPKTQTAEQRVSALESKYASMKADHEARFSALAPKINTVSAAVEQLRLNTQDILNQLTSQASSALAAGQQAKAAVSDATSTGTSLSSQVANQQAQIDEIAALVIELQNAVFPQV